MAVDMKRVITERGGNKFAKDLVKFCQYILKEATEHNEVFTETNATNRSFYEGRDATLDKRRNNSKALRAAMFVHEVSPAIDTRVTGAISKILSDRFPVSVRPANNEPGPDEFEQAAFIEEELNRQLRESGYLHRLFRQHILSSEIYRTPSTVKVGWEEHEEEVAVVVPADPMKQAMASALGKQLPPHVEFRKKMVSGPVVDILETDEFLYEPGNHNVADCNYFIHKMNIYKDELLSMAANQKWDLKKVKEAIDKATKDSEGVYSDNGSMNKPSVSDQANIERGEQQTGYNEGEMLVAEMYIRVYMEDGGETWDKVVFVANEYIVQHERSYFKGFGHPFVPIILNNLPGCIEGLSSIDLCMELQRLYNELFNSFLDGLVYRIFTPFKTTTGNTLVGEPKFEPAAIWYMTDINEFQPVTNTLGALPDLPPLMDAVSQKIRTILAASDVAQGFQQNQYEKATATRARAGGLARRQLGFTYTFGEALCSVAERYVAMNIQFADDGFMWVGNWDITVPSLMTEVDPMEERQEGMLMLEMAEKSKIYQNPIGERKIRNIIEYLARLVMKKDITRYVPTEQEMEGIIDVEMEVQATQLKQEAAAQAVAGVTAQDEAPKKKETKSV